jgi:hypothetical protein
MDHARGAAEPSPRRAGGGLIGARSVASAVDRMEASSFRNLAAVKDALHAPAAAVEDH